jgi:hypothetical protein
MEQDIANAIGSRDWYVLAAVLITIVLSIWDKFSSAAVKSLPKKYQFAPAMLACGLAAFVDAQVSGMGWKVALAMAAYGALHGMTSIGFYHSLKRYVPTMGAPKNGDAK